MKIHLVLRKSTQQLRLDERNRQRYLIAGFCWFSGDPRCKPNKSILLSDSIKHTSMHGHLTTDRRNSLRILLFLPEPSPFLSLMPLNSFLFAHITRFWTLHLVLPSILLAWLAFIGCIWPYSSNPWCILKKTHTELKSITATAAAWLRPMNSLLN